MTTKNQIARSIYGVAFDRLSAGEKAAVTRQYNSRSAPVAAGNAVECSVGRLNHNGSKKCIVSPNKTVAELIEQAVYTIDKKKESVTALSTGELVNLSDIVVPNETYIIAPEIKSAN